MKVKTYLFLFILNIVHVNKSFSQTKTYNLCDLGGLSDKEILFVETLNIDLENIFLEDLSQIKRISKLKWLTISSDAIPELKKIKAINKELKGIESIYGLTYSFDTLTKLPKIYKYCNGLKSFGVIGNVITKPLKFSKKAKNIENVEISVNNLSNISSTLSKLKMLKSLELNIDSLGQIPRSLRTVKSLNNLRISSKNIVRIPDLWKDLNNLEVLEISCPKLLEIQGDFSKMSLLKIVSLTDVRCLSKIPTGMKHLENLVQFKLHDAWEITSLSELESSRSLTDLLISGANLTPLVSDIESLESLEYLVVEARAIIQLSDTTIQKLSFIPVVELTLTYKEKNGSGYLIHNFNITSDEFSRIQKFIPGVVK